MQRVDPEDLLRKLAEIDEGAQAGMPSDELLRAFAADELAEEDALRTATLIAGNPAARERLAALTGVSLPRPRPRTRRRVLAALAEEAGALRRRAVWRWGLAATAVLAMAVAWPLLRSVFIPNPDPPLAVHDGTIGGIENVRSGATVNDKSTVAEPDTLVSIDVFPLDVAHPDPRFALYRQDGDQLEKVTVRWQRRDGSGRLKVPARALVGEVPGNYRLFAVVSRPGDSLPQRLRVAGYTPQARLTAGEGRGRQVIALQLKLIEP